MKNLPKRNFCHYCKRELKEGEGRYRFLQNKNEVECCPPCFDANSILPQRTSEEPAAEQTTSNAEKDF